MSFAAVTLHSSDSHIVSHTLLCRRELMYPRDRKAVNEISRPQIRYASHDSMNLYSGGAVIKHRRSSRRSILFPSQSANFNNYYKHPTQTMPPFNIRPRIELDPNTVRGSIILVPKQGKRHLGGYSPSSLLPTDTPRSLLKLPSMPNVSTETLTLAWCPSSKVTGYFNLIPPRKSSSLSRKFPSRFRYMREADND